MLGESEGKGKDGVFHRGDAETLRKILQDGQDRQDFKKTFDLVEDYPVYPV